MMDVDMENSSQISSFHSDASAAKELGYGCVFEDKWIFGRWENNFIDQFKPSIEVLELFALCAGILTWEKLMENTRLIVFCDNMGVVNMINNNASKCKRCMYLLRILTLNNLIHNRRITVRYIWSKDNILSDSLSRIDLKRFRRFGPNMKKEPDTITYKLWPLSKIMTLADK